LEFSRTDPVRSNVNVPIAYAQSQYPAAQFAYSVDIGDVQRRSMRAWSVPDRYAKSGEALVGNTAGFLLKRHCAHTIHDVANERAHSALTRWAGPNHQHGENPCRRLVKEISRAELNTQISIAERQ
jgi:hypothetical protein